MFIEDESYIANVGEKVCLICKLDSKPQVIDLTWWFNDEVISSTNDEHGDSRFQGGTIECPDLTITNITYTDKGSYTCCARNIIGTCTSSPIVLSVEGVYKLIIIIIKLQQRFIRVCENYLHISFCCLFYMLP